MKSRTIEKLIRVLKKGRFVPSGTIKTATTNGLQGHPRVLRKAFGLHKIEER